MTSGCCDYCGQEAKFYFENEYGDAAEVCGWCASVHFPVEYDTAMGRKLSPNVEGDAEVWSGDVIDYSDWPDPPGYEGEEAAQ